MYAIAPDFQVRVILQDPSINSLVLTPRRVIRGYMQPMGKILQRGDNWSSGQPFNFDNEPFK